MEPVIKVEERRTYPPASEYRMRRVKWDHVVVWSVVALMGFGTLVGAIRVAILLFHIVTLSWLR